MVPTLVVKEPLFSKRGLCVSNNLQQSGDQRGTETTGISDNDGDRGHGTTSN